MGWGLRAAMVASVLALGVPALRAEELHESRVDHGPVGGGIRWERGDGDDRRELRGRHELRLAELPTPPGGPGAPGEAAGPPGSVAVPADGLDLPNLAPLPPYDVWVGHAERPPGPVWSNLATLGSSDPPTRHALRFTTTILNRGSYSFELVGGPWLPDPDQPDLTTTHAYQCVRFDGPAIHGAPRACQRYDSVGTLTWHAQHRHFHINGFGRYELRRDRDGAPDMSPQGLVGRSQKVGWCVSDMWNWRHDRSPGEPGDTLDYFSSPEDRRWYQECTNAVLHAGASWRQGISPGWGDTYPAGYTGQEIPLRGVADGTYWIVITINPRDNEFGLRVLESTWADNTQATQVRLYAGGTKARLIRPIPRHPWDHWFANPDDQPGQ